MKNYIKSMVAERIPSETYDRSSIRFEGGRPRWIGTRIDLGVIQTLSQPRKTFEDIDSLAENIAEEDLINPLMVVKLDEESCEKYIETLNRLWGKTDHQISDLRPVIENGQPQYYILIAGERRFRACKFLQEFGCGECRQTYGSGGCYRRHSISGDDYVDVRLGVNLTPLQALSRQASENIHMPVPPHEEAKFYYRFFKLLRDEDPKYSMTHFARLVGRKVGRIREALKYCSLPEEIQELTEKGHLGYGKACQLARLNQAGLEGEELVYWVTRALVGGHRLDEFDRLITNFLRDRSRGNRSLFDIFTEEARREFEKPTFRRVVESNMVQGLWGFQHYWSRVIQLFRDGKIGHRDSPFSEGSTVRLYRTLIERLEQTLPYLKGHLPKRDYASIKLTLDESLEVIAGLEEEYQTREADAS